MAPPSIVWEWKNDNTSGNPYNVFDQHTSTLLEQGYQTYQTSNAASTMTLTHGFFGSSPGGYVINFALMNQRKVHSGFIRNIQRRVGPPPPPRLCFLLAIPSLTSVNPNAPVAQKPATPPPSPRARRVYPHIKRTFLFFASDTEQVDFSKFDSLEKYRALMSSPTANLDPTTRLYRSPDDASVLVAQSPPVQPVSLPSPAPVAESVVVSEQIPLAQLSLLEIANELDDVFQMVLSSSSTSPAPTSTSASSTASATSTSSVLDGGEDADAGDAGSVPGDSQPNLDLEQGSSLLPTKDVGEEEDEDEDEDASDKSAVYLSYRKDFPIAVFEAVEWFDEKELVLPVPICAPYIHIGHSLVCV